MATESTHRWLASFCTAVVLSACGGSSGNDAPATGTGTTVPPPPPVVPPTLAVQRVFPNLSFITPVMMLRAPGDNSRWFVLQQDGHVLVFDDHADVATTRPVLDISDRLVARNVHGTLGMAFHPGFPADPRVYVAYTNESATGGIRLRISEFMTTDNGSTVSPASEQILFQIEQPGGHNNGGHVLFGPDGFLYLAVGDGGDDDSQSGVVGNGQTLTTLLGKILRLDVDGSAAGRRYRIPGDNPFAGNPPCNADGTGTQNCPEIYAWGFRNPWRWSFDRQGGQLWLGDVGSHSLEEIDRVAKGGNYGWRCFEGTRNTGFTCGSPSDPLLPPVAEYDHTLGVAVTGGYIYRGSALPGLVGRYVFGDYGSGRIWNIAADTQPTMTMTAAAGVESGLHIASFAEDSNGEIFLADVGNGQLYRLISSP